MLNRLIALAVMIISVLEIAAYCLHGGLLSRLGPSFGPIPVESSIILFLLALKQWLLLRGNRKAARFVITVVLIGCLLFVWQYVARTKLLSFLYGGHIPMNAVMGLYSLALAEWIMAFRQKTRHLLTSGFFGATAFCLGMLSWIGVWRGLHVSFTWGSLQPMEPIGAICVIALGIGIFLESYELAYQSGKPETYEPILISAAFLFVMFGFWQAFVERDAARVRQLERDQGHRIVEELNHSFNEQYFSAIRRARRLSWNPWASYRDWRLDASLYIQYYPETRYLAVLNPDGSVKWSEADQNESVYPFTPFLFHPVDPEEESQVTKIVYIDKNERGIALKVSNLLSVISTDVMIEKAIRLAGPEGYEFRIVEEGTNFPVYHDVRKSAKLDAAWGTDVPLENRLVRWKIRVIPTPQTLRDSASLLPVVVILAGVVISFLFMSLIYFAMSTRRREQELELNRSFLETILSQLPVALFCKDVKNGFRFSVWNRKAEELWGLKSEHVIGKSDYEFFPQEQADWFRENDEQIVRDGVMKVIPEELVSSPVVGDVYVRTRKVPILDENGEPSQLLGISEDITEQKRNQEIIEKQRLQMVNTAKMTALGEMAGGIAHEINNPLAIIEVYAGQLTSMAETGTLDSERVVRAAGVISSTVDRIAKITRGLRSFARDAAEDPFVRSKIGVVVSETLEFCQEKFTKNGVQLILTPISESLQAECRPVQISQVLLNLLNNSFDAVVGTRDAWVKVEAEDAGEKVRISVTDSGHGVPPEVAEKIMQPFFTTKGVGKGTGLGLSISQGIIRSHHGELELDRSSKNTRFVIAIPKQQHENQG